MSDERSAQEVARWQASVHELPKGWYAEEDLALLAEATKAAVQSTCEGALVEVGVYRGYSARAIVRQAGIRPVYLIDSLELDGADPADWPRGDNVVHMLARPTVWIEPVALLHQDADHGRDVVLAHLELFGPHMLPGSIVALHDYHEPQYPGVRTAWNAFSLAGKFEPWGRGASVQVFMRT